MKKPIVIFIGLLGAVLLAFTIRGIPGNPTADELNRDQWKDNGPFELSPDRGRFALLYSLVEDSSFYYSLPLARFATPDLGRVNGNYVSLFAPLMSFILVPGYIIGKSLGASQVGTFAVISLFALMNVFFIRAIAIRFGSNRWAATLAGFVFLFATPGFAYAVSLYQHHISTFFILMSLLILLKTDKIWPLSVIWFLFAASLPLDYPNAFLMLPVALTALGRMMNIETSIEKVRVRIHLLGFGTLIVAIVPIVFFFWFNASAYGSPVRFLGGAIERVKSIGSDGLPAPLSDSDPSSVSVSLQKQSTAQSLLHFFNPRNMLDGLTIHLISRDRGILVYTPVILFAALGAFVLYKKNAKHLPVFLGVVGVNIVLYSMWSDPWGGWAFGSRYLIPSYAILSIFIAIAVSRWKKNILFTIVFLVVLIYSVGVNSLGALTTNRLPPQVEVLALEKISGTEQKYSYDRNIALIDSGLLKSFTYQVWANSMFSSWQYYFLIVGSIVILCCALYIGAIIY